MIYYLVQGFSKEEDEKWKTHLYPCYLTSYKLTLGGEGFGLQSGFHDALKFTSLELAEKWKAKGEEVFGKCKEFAIVPMDSRLLGRAELKYIVGACELEKDVKHLIKLVEKCDITERKREKVTIDKRALDFISDCLLETCRIKMSDIKDRFNDIDEKMKVIEVGTKLYQEGPWEEVFELEVIKIVDKEKGIVEIKELWCGDVRQENVYNVYLQANLER